MIAKMHSLASPRITRAAIVLIASGAATAAYGLYNAPGRTWPNLLLNGFYFTSLALSATVFLAAQRLTGARWSASLRRIPEAFMMSLPLAAVLTLAIFLGRHTLYPWARTGAFSTTPAIAGKVRYLSPPWVLVRAVALFVTWLAFVWRMRKASLAQDKDLGSSLVLDRRLTRQAAVFIPVFSVTFSVSAFDWIISLEPQWFSTMFAIYVFAGAFVQGIAAVTLAATIFKEAHFPADVVSESQLRDLGKMLFAFSTFWAYIWICQYLLIWYGNIPQEATYYIERTNSRWIALFVLNLLVNWLIPFAALLSAKAKRNLLVLKVVGALLLAGHWLDLYLLIMPAVSSTPRLGLPELLIASGYGALFYLYFVRNLAKAPIVPLHDPILLVEAMTSSAFEGSAA